MALSWNWNEKVGEAFFVSSSGDEWCVDLYQGNAFLIMIREFKDKNDVDKYEIVGFFCDKAHMKNCLGLNKKGGYTENIYARDYFSLDRITIYSDRYSYTSDLVSALAKAFKSLNIQISNWQYEFGAGYADR